MACRDSDVRIKILLIDTSHLMTFLRISSCRFLYLKFLPCCTHFISIVFNDVMARENVQTTNRFIFQFSLSSSLRTLVCTSQINLATKPCCTGKFVGGKSNKILIQYLIQQTAQSLMNNHY
jgi:hypothetical protein